ncbi:ABC transporter ATP-binding protein [Pseudochelatococcus contaminans]|uniref:Simple sugar transport system ATP-binding protein n=1 Tax=Pseudochelatococcus contaminans TaxID=1538103 RepID=A0A7W6EHP0_9HYPH|nr:ABC transporter ATP-binding protein [Pseudochelatococcus contaminans]MBB3810305.1 simple sugar transport system ATP-binding protein [Pseudochelatococcus contaminans]
MSSRPILKLSRITKRFGAVIANDDVSISLAQGEILALLGENGAGKTTLMNILFGHYAPDEGTVSVDGALLPPGQPLAAIRAGVGMVHQHFSLAPNLTVLENVMTGTEPLWSFRSARTGGRRKLVALSERFGLIVDPDARVGDLSVGERQRVEILKALYNDARILILDEPTAVLTRQEAERLFAVLRQMARQGLSLVLISHKLDEVMTTADRVVVLRGGKVAAERMTADTDKAELAELMVGRRVTRPARAAAKRGAIAFEAAGLCAAGAGAAPLDTVSFRLYEGEILAIIGVSGNGQTTLADVMFGTRKPDAGDLLLHGRPFEGGSVWAVHEAGIGRIPEDRNREGVVGDMTIWENAVLERIRSPRFSRRGIVDRAAGIAFAEQIMAEFDVRGGTPTRRIRALSGGNVQKLILGRNLLDNPRIIVAAQPTRGLDEGAVVAVHDRLLEARQRGAALMLISEDLDEVIGLADRVQAIVKGRLSPPVPADRADPRLLGLMMAGDWQRAGDISAGEMAHAS